MYCGVSWKYKKVLSGHFSTEGNGEHPTSLASEQKIGAQVRTLDIYRVKTKCYMRT